MSAVPDWMADLAQRAGGDGSSAKEKAERDALWTGEFTDELTVAIALREWDKAVSYVEQGEIELDNCLPFKVILIEIPRQGKALNNTTPGGQITTIDRISDHCPASVPRASNKSKIHCSSLDITFASIECRPGSSHYIPHFPGGSYAEACPCNQIRRAHWNVYQ